MPLPWQPRHARLKNFPNIFRLFFQTWIHFQTVWTHWCFRSLINLNRVDIGNILRLHKMLNFWKVTRSRRTVDMLKRQSDTFKKTRFNKKLQPTKKHLFTHNQNTTYLKFNFFSQAQIVLGLKLSDVSYTRFLFYLQNKKQWNNHLKTGITDICTI